MSNSKLSEAEARIFLADQRGRSQLEWFRSYYTFNFGSYRPAHREPFGRLTTLNDETLKAGTTMSYAIDHDSVVVLIPLQGDLKYEYQAGNSGLIAVGQVSMHAVRAGEMMHITNPYEIELISFIHIRLSTSVTLPLHKISGIGMDESPNKLVAVSSTQHAIRISFGKFDGRVDEVHALLDSSKGAFVFVIDGAFEVENRLLQSRDGLAISKTSQIELESLSSNAIILFIEAI